MSWQFEKLPDGHRLEAKWQALQPALLEALPDPGKVKAELGWCDFDDDLGFRFRAKVGDGRGRVFKFWQTYDECPLPRESRQHLVKAIHAEQAG